MYNLLLILLTLKGEHVDRDLTYEGLVGFDVMNTKLGDFVGGGDQISSIFFSHRENWIGHTHSDWRISVVVDYCAVVYRVCL